MANKTFVLDVHLGKLAHHLRMVGFDSHWTFELTDPELLQISKDEHRILLTRDRELSEKAPPALCHYVQAIEPGAQFVEVLKQFGLTETALSYKGFLSRCLECNSPIVQVSDKQIADRIPQHVQEIHKEFYFCPRCERVYWKGSHFERMKTWVEGKLASDISKKSEV